MGVGLFSLDPVTGQEDGLKLTQGWFKLDIRKKFFTERLIGHLNGLSRELVDSISLEVLRKRLNEALSAMV